MEAALGHQQLCWLLQLLQQVEVLLVLLQHVVAQQVAQQVDQQVVVVLVLPLKPQEVAQQAQGLPLAQQGLLLEVAQQAQEAALVEAEVVVQVLVVAVLDLQQKL